MEASPSKFDIAVEFFLLHFNLITGAILLIAFFISYRSPNIRWLLAVIVIIKTIDILFHRTILQWGYGYFLVISLYDFAGIYCIFYRNKLAEYLSNLDWPSDIRLVKKLESSFKKFSLDNVKFYKLTPNEITVLGVYILSILVNLLSVVERLIRKNTGYNPMFIYKKFPSVKFTLSVIMLMVFISVAINGFRGIYKDHRA